MQVHQQSNYDHWFFSHWIFIYQVISYTLEISNTMKTAPTHIIVPLLVSFIVSLLKYGN